MNKEKLSSQKKWLLVSSMSAFVAVVVGIISILQPGYIKVDNSTVSWYGSAALFVGIITFIISLIAIFKMKTWKTRIAIVFFAVVEGLVAFMGYFTQWWYS